MPNIFDTTLLLIYLLPLLGFLLGILPATLVWHLSRLKRSRGRRKALTAQVNNRFTLSL